MRPQDVVATVEPERWETILTALRENAPELWRDLERGAMADQRVPPKLWQRYSVEQRRTAIRRALRAPASTRLALDAVREYLLVAQRPMLIRFLDALGIPHEEGALGEEPLDEPEPARLDAAVDALLAEFPRPDVLLYLRTFAAHESAPWPRLAERLAALEEEPDGGPPSGPGGPSGGAPRPTESTAPAPAPPAASSPSAPPAAVPPAESPPALPRDHGSAAPSTGEQPPAAPPRGVELAGERRGRADRQRPPPAPRGSEDARPAPASVAAPPRRVSTLAPAAAPPGSREAAVIGHAALPGSVADPAPGAAPIAPIGPLAAAPNRDPAPPNGSNPRSVPGAPPSESDRTVSKDADISSRTRHWSAPSPGADLGPGLGLPSHEAGPERLTPLDTLLARTIIATLSDVRGAPSETELWAIVEEVLHLSARRAQSYYHAGLLEALTDTAHPLDRRGWSPARWDWYHYGRLVGWTRQQRWAELARFYADEPAAVQRLLRSPEGMAPWAGPLLFDGLLAADAPLAAADVLRQFSGLAPLADCVALLDAAVERLEEDRGPEAYEILDVLQQLHPFSPPASSAGPRPVEALPVYRARLRRAQARAAQAQGLFESARVQLEAALATAEGPERADLLGDLGLVAGEFGRLAEVRLPEADADPQPWIRRLEAGAPHFAAAVEIAPSRSAAASFGLAALEWLRERPALARRHFEAALHAMQERRRLYRRTGVLPQVQFYLGATLLLELDPPVRERALGLLRDALAAGLRASDAAWSRLLETVALDPALAPTLFDLFSQQQPAPRRELAHAFLVRCAQRSEAARQRLARESARADLPAPQRWELLLGLLEAQRRAGDDEAARGTLDQLEALAHSPNDRSRQLLERWRAFLARPENYEPAWSAEDVLWSRVRTLELLGRDDEAFWLLDMPFNRLLADGTPEALASAEALLARARQLGASPEAREAVREMSARLRAREEVVLAEPGADAERVAAQLRAGRSLRVLFLGGNETQERHEQDLRRALARRDETTGAEVTLTFLYPGFNSNWDKALESVRSLRGRLDALVLMPFVRTELGRAVRRLCSEMGIPWVACTGKGYDSMERALRTALELAAERPPPDRGVRRAS